MKIISPTRVTDSTLISSTIAEDDYAEWSSATAYAVGDFVISIATHTIYRSLTANTNKNPDLEQVALADPLIADPDPVNWQVIGATDRWKLFDSKPTQRAIAAENINIVNAPGVFIGGVAGINISANNVTVSMMDGVDEVYSRTIAMQDESGVIDAYTYFFTEIAELSEFVLTDLPPYSNAEVTVSINREGGNVSVGQVVMGPVWETGLTFADGSGFSGLDFSSVETDVFGNLTRVVREATTISNFEVFLDAGQLLTFRNRMRQLRGGVAAVWIGSDDQRKAAINYGILRDYRVSYQTPLYSVIQLETQGLV
ncbi:MAG: hypothetical protein II336_18150 [Loktanella sp.]|nr:hypothetical protein [Loktanella sp.]